jgi:hypothetical protein
MRWDVAHIGVKRSSYKMLEGKEKGRRPLGNPKCILEDNIKMNLTDRMGYMDWIHLSS